MAARGGKVGGLSSLLVGRESILLMIIAAFAANWFGFFLLAALLLLLGLVGLFSRLWGLSALHRVEAEVDAAHKTLSAGETLTLRCRIKNEKLLPLLWLEFCLPLPPGDCLVPDGSFTRCKADPVPSGPEERAPLPDLYRRRLSLLLWYRTVEWESVWTARRRGIYQPGGVLLRAGDGFGLTQSLRQVPIPSAPAFVIYPKLIPVDTSPFLKNVWAGQTGARGYLEDPTVLRGVRDYQPGDAWKRIDWRMAARQGELQVRLYDTILPRSIHFILDVASFLNLSPENDELEDALSVLASLVLLLERRGVRCGLSLPQTGAAPNLDLLPNDLQAGADDLLFQLAALDADGATELFSEQVISGLQQRAGQLCLLTCGGARVTCRSLLARLDSRALTVISLFPPEAAQPWFDSRVFSLAGLKREGAA